MKKQSLFFLIIVMVALLAACDDNKEERERIAALEEQQRIEQLYFENIESLSGCPDAWLSWYLQTKGTTPGTFQVYYLRPGQTVDYDDNGTLREGKLKEELFVPRFPPAYATMINGNVIQRCAKPIKYLVEIEPFPYRIPAQLLIDIDDDDLIFEAVMDDWLLINDVQELKEWSRHGSERVILPRVKRPSLLVNVYDYTGDEQGLIITRFYVLKDNTIKEF